ncbi:MAG: hypothetical protein F4X63_08180 [Nitrospira sp. SB0662_bin_26]|nr:hypothetical protein [Nitrospira sp. SB0662_bin_26]
MAITLTADELRTLIDVDLDTATRLLGVASAEVERYAHGSTVPGPVLNEAVIRCAGFLYGMPKSAIRSETAGPLNVHYAANNVSALRHSGAMALLSPFKQRRAV